MGTAPGSCVPFHTRARLSRCGCVLLQGAGNLGRSTRGVCDDARYPPPVWSGVRERACGTSTTNPRSCEPQGDSILAGSNRTDQLPPCDSSTHLVQPMLQAPARRPHRTTLHSSRLPAQPFPEPPRASLASRQRPHAASPALRPHAALLIYSIPGGFTAGTTASNPVPSTSLSHTAHPKPNPYWGIKKGGVYREKDSYMWAQN